MESVEAHRRYSPKQLRFVLITASDSRSRDNDESGDRIAEMLREAGHEVIARHLVADDEVSIRLLVGEAAGCADVDGVIVSGGTGFSPRDVTIEAIHPLIDRSIEGFGELFRMLSFERIGAAAMLSRATAGVIGETVAFLLPGSPAAVELAMAELILPEVGHLVGQLRRGRAARS